MTSFRRNASSPPCVATDYIVVMIVFVSVQTMNMLMVYQSVVDTLVSSITLMIAVVEVDNTRMSRDIV